MRPTRKGEKETNHREKEKQKRERENDRKHLSHTANFTAVQCIFVRSCRNKAKIDFVNRSRLFRWKNVYRVL